MAVHSFDTKVAEKYGIPEAVVLWNLSYWQNKNEANEINFHDGRYWTYNSVSSFGKLFTYLSSKQISRILLKLEKQGAIVSGCYNKMKIDRTKWYSVEPEIMTMHNLSTIGQEKEMQWTKTSNAMDKNVQSILPNEEMQFTKSGNAIYQMGEPIPDSKPNRKQNNKTITHSKNASESIYSFEEFWDDYGKKIDRKKCKAVYDKLSEKDREDIYNSIGLYVIAYPEKKFRKNPLTYLNGRCWEDDIEDILESRKVDAPKRSNPTPTTKNNLTFL